MSFEHVFDQLEISTHPFAVCELRGKCDMDIGQEANVSLHYILTGEGELTIQGGPAIQVSPGSLVLVPALQSHALHSYGIANESFLKCDSPELKLPHMLKTDHTLGQQCANHGATTKRWVAKFLQELVQG